MEESSKHCQFLSKPSLLYKKIYKLHRERAVNGRIFQALPIFVHIDRRTDTMFALIYKIVLEYLIFRKK